MLIRFPVTKLLTNWDNGRLILPGNSLLGVSWSLSLGIISKKRKKELGITSSDKVIRKWFKKY